MPVLSSSEARLEVMESNWLEVVYPNHSMHHLTMVFRRGGVPKAAPWKHARDGM